MLSGDKNVKGICYYLLHFLAEICHVFIVGLSYCLQF